LGPISHKYWQSFVSLFQLSVASFISGLTINYFPLLPLFFFVRAPSNPTPSSSFSINFAQIFLIIRRKFKEFIVEKLKLRQATFAFARKSVSSGSGDNVGVGSVGRRCGGSGGVGGCRRGPAGA